MVGPHSTLTLPHHIHTHIHTNTLIKDAWVSLSLRICADTAQVVFSTSTLMTNPVKIPEKHSSSLAPDPVHKR